jgi:hypothetical protein
MQNPINNSLSEFLDKINNYFDTSIQIGLTKKKWHSFNIFNKMYEKVESELSLDLALSLHFTFSTCYKSLEDARNLNLNSSQFWLEYLNYSNPKETTNSALIRNSITLPAFAFHKYADKNYNGAISELELAIYDMDVFGKENNMPLMLSACAEQYMNVCRVMFKMGNNEEAFKQLGKLLYFLHTGENSLPISFGKWTQIDMLEEDIRLSMINFITNDSLKKLFYTDNYVGDNVTLLNVLFFDFFKNENAENKYYYTYRQFVHSINYYLNNDYWNFLHTIFVNIKHINTLPNLLQSLIYDSLIKVAADIQYGNQITLGNNITYYQEFLEIKTVFLNKKEAFLKSPLRQSLQNVVS